jgi:ADP-ribosylglycohydrolase
MERPVNSSKGCGGLMRIAPVGLFVGEPAGAFELGCRIAALTHGHPSGYLAAGALAHLTASLLSGARLESALEDLGDLLKRQRHHEECASALERGIRAASERDASAEVAESLGAGWVAEEALAIGVYAALAARGDFERGVRLAVNHSGDSDSTGAVAGTILGTMLGKEGIPSRYLERLELAGAIEEIARDLATRFREEAEWEAKYPRL